MWVHCLDTNGGDVKRHFAWNYIYNHGNHDNTSGKHGYPNMNDVEVNPLHANQDNSRF